MYDITPKNKDGMNIRANHNTTSEIVGSLDYGVHGVGELTYEIKVNGEAKDAKLGDLWLQITSPMAGWVAVIHDGTALSTLTSTDQPPVGDFPQRYRLTEIRPDGSMGDYADYERVLK